MTRPDLDAIAALLEGATPGPWCIWDDDPLAIMESNEKRARCVCDIPAASSNPDALADAALIVAAVNALPALLAYVRELESLVERMARSDSNVAIAMRERCAQACESVTWPDSATWAKDFAAAIRALEP